MPFQKTDAGLIYALDLEYPPTGTIGYIIPLDATLALNQTFTANASTDVLTFATAQKFRTGSRVRFVSTTTIPTGLVGGTDYYLQRLTSTTFKACATLVDAIAGTAINLMDAGSGTMTANEQALTRQDTIDVLLSHEFASGLTVPRPPITNIGPSVVSGTSAQKTMLITIQNSSGATLSIGYFLLTRGGTGAIGDVPADHQIDVLTNPFSLAPGESKIYNLTLTYDL